MLVSITFFMACYKHASLERNVTGDAQQQVFLHLLFLLAAQGPPARPLGTWPGLWGPGQASGAPGQASGGPQPGLWGPPARPLGPPSQASGNPQAWPLGTPSLASGAPLPGL